MKIHVEIHEEDLKRMICDHLSNIMGDVKFTPDYVRIEVKSKQNFKAEWEQASFRAIYETT